MEAWSENVLHGDIGSIWCNISGSDFTATTEWRNSDNVVLTRGCNVVNTQATEYVLANPLCDEEMGLYVFDVAFDRTRDCGYWQCHYSDWDVVDVLIAPAGKTLKRF